MHRSLGPSARRGRRAPGRGPSSFDASGGLVAAASAAPTGRADADSEEGGRQSVSDSPSVDETGVRGPRTDEQTVPALPCVSLSETFDFYRLLGFEVIYQQASPNPYGVVRRGGYELHFFGLKGLKPEEAYSTCLVIVPEVERLHQTFADGLRQGYGKLPVAGFPRITRMRKGQGRFTVVDPSGNSVIFIKRDGPSAEAEEAPQRADRSRLARAMDTAARLRDSKGDDAGAAKVLDVALARKDP